MLAGADHVSGLHDWYADRGVHFMHAYGHGHGDNRLSVADICGCAYGHRRADTNIRHIHNGDGQRDTYRGAG